MRNAKHGRIVKAAIRLEGEIYTGYRHADILRDMRDLGISREKLHLLDQNWDQGFITETGRFLSRKQAMNYGLYIGQITKTKSATLTSEDLWKVDGSPLDD
jgi:hypothetical protein